MLFENQFTNGFLPENQRDHKSINRIDSSVCCISDVPPALPDEQLTMDISTKHLRAFTALAAHCNFTRAAQICHLSQPAFSALIQSLEIGAGTRLFRRTTRSVELTYEGHLFERTARRLLADFESAQVELRDHVQLRKGRVAVAALPSIAAGVLPGLLSEFRMRHPGIDLEVHDALSDACIELIQGGYVDIAFAAATAPAVPGLTVEIFCTDNFFLVCHRDHPLAHLPSVKPEQLVGHDFIQLGRSTSIRQRLEHALKGYPLKPGLEVEHLATVAAFVKANLGISIIPALALFQFQDDLIRIKPIDAEGLQRDIHIVTGGKRAPSTAADALLDLIRSARGEIQSKLSIDRNLSRSNGCS